MALELVALLCTGLFAGAAVYVTLVEHPATEATTLLARWGTLHTVRTAASGAAFLLLGLHIAGSL